MAPKFKMLEHDIPYQNKARVYEVEPGQEGRALIITTSSKPAGYVNEILSRPNIPLISDLQESLKLPDFINPQNPEWGFGPVMQTDSDGEQVKWICNLPKYNRLAGYDWTIPQATSATLMATFMVLGMAEDVFGGDKNQLLHIQLATSREVGSGLIVTLGSSIVPWLNSFPNEYFHEELQETMKVAYDHLTGEPTDKYFFRAWFRQPKWVNLDCPGNACALYPESYNNKSLDIGYRLLPHNVDAPYQQLTLLSGVALMHAEARKAGY